MLKAKIKSIYLKRLILGCVIGSTGGFAYYYFIGCSSGSCPLTSNPYTMIAYGALVGFVLFYKTKKIESEKDSFK